MPFHVLLVEDNPGDVMLARIAVAEAGVDCELHVVSDSADAVRFIHGRGEFWNAPKPDLIIMDWRLPYRSGTELLAEIRNLHDYREVPVVVYSACRVPEESKKAREFGANGWLSKSTDLDRHLKEFAELVRDSSRVSASFSSSS